MMISNLYETVTYIADESACRNLKSLLAKCNVDCPNVEYIEKRFSFPKFRIEGLTYLAKLAKVSFLNYKFYKQAPEDADVFYNNNLFFAIMPISFLRKKNNTYVLCHNEMELINKMQSYSVATSLLSRYFRLVFCKFVLSEKLHFILLSPEMVRYFSTFISPKNTPRMYWMDHAYIRPENPENPDFRIRGTHIKIGIPGAITPSRGLNTLKQVLSRLHNNDICIYALSTCSEKIEDKHFVMLNSTGRLLPFEEYNAYVQSMDAMLLLYDTNSYKLTASGAILESIWSEKPVIALRNAYFEYLFTKYGDLGILCNDIETLVKGIDKFNVNSIYKKNVVIAKNSLNPVSVQTQLLKIVNV